MLSGMLCKASGKTGVGRCVTEGLGGRGIPACLSAGQGQRSGAGGLRCYRLSSQGKRWLISRLILQSPVCYLSGVEGVIEKSRVSWWW